MVEQSSQSGTVFSVLQTVDIATNFREVRSPKSNLREQPQKEKQQQENNKK